MAGCKPTAQFPKSSLKTVTGVTYQWKPKKEKSILLLDFWATWCEPCKDSIPLVEKLSKQFRKEDVEFVYVNTDSESERKEVLEQIQAFQIKKTVLLDTKQEWVHHYNVTGIPCFLILSSKGEILYRQYGISPEEIPGIALRIQNELR